MSPASARCGDGGQVVLPAGGELLHPSGQSPLRGVGVDEELRRLPLATSAQLGAPVRRPGTEPPFATVPGASRPHISRRLLWPKTTS